MRYVSIDIETLGLDPETCDIVEFGAVIDNGDALVDLPRFHCYFTKDTFRGEAYAMYMHNTILQRIAKREEPYHYLRHDQLEGVFGRWLSDHNIVKPIIAGKNFGSFDLQFLKKIGFVEHDHRFIDPGSMYLRWKDNRIPGLDTCLKRAGFNHTVNHTAIEDALDVIRCIRKALSC